MYAAGTDTVDVGRTFESSGEEEYVNKMIQIVVEYGSSVCWTSKYVAKEQACTK